jgi:HSP90 family molecular chaperone
VWSSSADGGFTIAEDVEGPSLGRGTLIRLHLKPEALEYAEESKLRDLVGKYSEFINFPIYLQVEKEVEVAVEEEEEPQAGEAEEAAAEEVEDDTEEEEEEDQGESGCECWGAGSCSCSRRGP